VSTAQSGNPSTEKIALNDGRSAGGQRILDAGPHKKAALDR
jgi:hypothetical protein